MHRVITVFIFVFIAATATPANAQSPTSLSQARNTDGAVRLPTEGTPVSLSDRSVPLRVPLPEGMQAIVDPATGMIHRAFGRPLRIDGYDAIDDGNVRAAAEAFLRQYRASIGVPPEELRLQRLTRVRDRWYVTWQQVYDGMPVLLSEVELRLFANGNVTAFGANVFPRIQIDARPAISASDAWSSAGQGLAAEQSMRKAALPQPAVLPVKRAGQVDYHMVYPLAVTEEDGRRWRSCVDAATGELLWRYSRSFDAGEEVVAHGGVTLVHPHEAELTDMPFADMFVTVDGHPYVSDRNGHVTPLSGAQGDVAATFAGPWCAVNLVDRENGAFTGTLQTGQQLDLTWDDQNSHRFERILFYHTNRNRRYLKEIDPNFDALDVQMKVEVEFDGQQPNAYSNGDEVHFLAAGDPSMRMAAAPMVLYHELGHSVNTLMYQQLGVNDGMRNMVCQEGTADLHAAMIVDYPRMGTGVFADNENRVMRNLENGKTYPESMTNEAHHDGQILSGAFWNLRKATSLELVRHLSHFAKYGLPDDPNDGVAFSEWFLETLIADDDDGDLSNGTPHAKEIAEAFGRHHIGSGLFMKDRFRHLPHENTADTLEPYALEFVLQTIGIAGGGATDLHVRYRLDGSKTEHRIEVQSDGQGEYLAMIPAQPRGTIVSYYFVATDELSGREVRFTPGMHDDAVWQFLVGFDLFFVDACENDRGWTVGSDDDSATRNTWERGEPDMIRLGSGEYTYLIQPGEDHSDFGSQCYATGLRGGSYDFVQHIPNGRCTLTSPVLDMRDIRNPVLDLWYHFHRLINPRAENPVMPLFTIAISSDGGGSWTTAFVGKESTSGFTRIRLRIEDYVERSDAVQFRCILDTPPYENEWDPPAMSNALIDDITIYAVTDGSPTPVDPPGHVPTTAMLCDAYPNPTRGAASISFAVDAPQQLRLQITDALGRRVATLAEGFQSQGMHTVRWNGLGVDGRPVPAGNYYIHLTTSSREVMTRRIVVR